MPKVIVSLKELKAKKTNDVSLVIIDLRSKEAYEKGHLVGAINLDAKKYFIGKDTYLPNLIKLGEALGQKGIHNNSDIVLVDDGSFRQAARAYFVFYYLNHSQVAILDDKDKEDKLTKKVPKKVKSTYLIKPIESRAVLIDYIQEKTIDDSSTLIDSRSAERYLGEKEPKYKQAGHIPNAVNYTSKAVFDEDGKWRSSKELKKHFKQLEEADEVIVSCGSGGSACLNLVGLKIAGIKNVKMYSGGFSEWIDEGNEISKT